MPNYRRYYIANHPIFISCVCAGRQPYLSLSGVMEIIWETLRITQKQNEFHLLAYVFLPDHFHWLLQLPDGAENFSKILSSFKWWSAAKIRKHIAWNRGTSFWQKRFYDHVIRDEADYSAHFDYIHWNPVKHGWVNNPIEWAQSSFAFWQQKGIYEPGWGQKEPPKQIQNLELE